MNTPCSLPSMVIFVRALERIALVGFTALSLILGHSFSGTASTSAALLQTVNKVGTSVTLVSSANPSAFNQAVKFTATVKAATSGTPTGTVTFKNGATTLATAALSAGKAAFTTATLAVGVHSITAEYNGNTDYNPSTSPALSQTVNKAGTSVTLVSSVNPSAFNQAVKFTATVKAATSGTPTGTVTFKNGATTLATAALSAAKAAFTTATLAVGVHSITAEYNGNTDYNPSTSPALSQTVNKEPSCPTKVNLTLCGTYAIGLRGFNSRGGPVAMGGSFVADDSGNIISGMIGVNQSGARPAINTIIGGSYRMDPSGDGRGVLTLINSSAISSTFRFVLESLANAGLGQIEEFDKSGTLAAGVIGGPETSPIPQIPPHAIVALSLEGINGSGQLAAMLGEFEVGSGGCDGAAGSFDSVADEPLVTNTAGTVNRSLAATGSCTAADPNTGLGTAQITISGGIPFTNSTLHFAYVAIGSGTQLAGALFLETDPIAANQPILNGFVSGVAVPTGGFKASSLGCPCLLVQDGATNGTSTTGHSVASIIRLLTTPGAGASGTLTGIEDTNFGGAITLAAALGPYDYTVDAKGIGTISGSSTIHFVITSNAVETLDESVSVLTGSFRPQNATIIEDPGLPYIVGLGNGDLSGVDANVDSAVGVITPSGATSGTLTGTLDVISRARAVVGTTASGTYSLDSATGRGTGSANLSGGTSSISIVIYARRGRQFIVLDIQSRDPYQLGARLQ